MFSNNDEFNYSNNTSNNADIERLRQLSQLVIEDDEDDVFFNEETDSDEPVAKPEPEPIAPEPIPEPEPIIPEPEPIAPEPMPEPEPIIPEPESIEPEPMPEPEPIIPEPEPIVPEPIPEPEPIIPEPAIPVNTDDFKAEINRKYRGNMLTREDIDDFISVIKRKTDNPETESRLSFISDKYFDAESSGDFAKYFIELKRLYRDTAKRKGWD